MTRDRAGAPVPALLSDVCQVWWARTADLRPEHDALLAQEDVDRRSRLHRAADRERTTLATALVRIVLAAHTGRSPDRLRIDRTCAHCGAQHGKPRLPELPDLHFSVSHSSDCVVVAVTSGHPVGVDVEEIAPWDIADWDEVALLTLAPEERAVLCRQPAPVHSLAFTTYWTRKEAAVKATGAGLTVPLDELVVSAPSSPPRVLRWGGRDAGQAPPALHALHPPAGFVGTLAVVAAPPTSVVERDAGPLLRAAAAWWRPAAAGGRSDEPAAVPGDDPQPAVAVAGK